MAKQHLLGVLRDSSHSSSLVRGALLFLIREIILTVLKSAAEVSVTIKNAGMEPYRPEVYGDSITVTRHFTQAGNASYKIKNKLGRTVSTTRDELSAILDHYLIDVDNPMNILTQGAYVDADY